jgi:ribosomal protein S16
VTLDVEDKAKAWLAKGALPTDRVAALPRRRPA